MDSPTLDALLQTRSEIESVLSRIDVWLLIFGVLVVIGVGGESVFGIKAWLSNRKLRDVERLIEGERDIESKTLEKETETLKGNNLALEAEVLRLQEKLADRHFSAAQRAELVTTLIPFSGQQASFSSRWDKPEAVGFGRELFDLLAKDAHWQMKDIGGLMGRENPEERGVEVDVSHLGTPARAKALVDVLNHIGIAAHFGKREDAFAVEGVLIIVNSKP